MPIRDRETLRTSRWRIWGIVGLLCSVLSSGGCVGVTLARNWRPETALRDEDFRQCLKLAQKINPSVKSSGPIQFNQCHPLAQCLESRGYHVRSESALEVASDILLSPIYFFPFVGGACFKLGLGKSASPF